MRLRFFVLFLFVCVFMLFGSCSFASFSSSTQQDIISKVTILRDKGVISDSVLTSVINNVSSSNFSSNYNNYFIFIGNGTRYNGGSSGRVSKMVTSPCLYIGQISSTSVSNFTNDSSNMLYTTWSGVYEGLRVYLNSASSGWGNFAYNDAVDGFYCYTSSPINTRLLSLGAGEEIGGSYLVYTGPVFTPSNNGTIQVVASNNLSENMLRLPFTYTGQSDWTLGYLTDYDEVYSIFGNFGPMFYRDDQLYTEAYQNQFSYNIYSGTNNGGLIFDSSTGRISIKKEKLVNKQGFSLLLQYRLNNGDSVDDIGEYHYYAYFYNLNISSGDLMSPDINSTVDIGMLNALDDYFSYDSGDNLSSNVIFGFSGDFFSGDIFGSNILNDVGLIDYTHNEYSLTLYGFYRRIIDVLLDDSTTSYIDFNYRGNYYRFYASDFKTPDGPLKIFVSGFIIVLLIIGFIKWLAILFKKMATLDYVGVSKSFDIDDSNFL